MSNETKHATPTHSLESSDTNPSLPPELANLFYLLESALQLDHDTSEIFQKFFISAFTEKLGGQALLKPNAIPFALRSYQEAGLLPQDPQQLKELLSHAVTGIVDAANIKKINEDLTIGGSYQAGDATLLLHLESLKRAADANNLILLVFRPQGDEFLPLFIPKNSTSIDIKQLTQEIEAQTQKLITTATSDPSHPLNKLASNHPDLLTKTMSFINLENISLPQQINRSADFGEVILAQAEKAKSPQETPSSAFKARLKKLIDTHLAGSVFPEISITGDQSAIDHLVDSIRDTIELSAKEIDTQNINKRKQLLQTYCPASLAGSLEKILISVQNDPAKQALMLKVLEESFFNTQFERDPPILNRWIALEHLRQSNASGKPLFPWGGMLSTYFLKLINLSDGRLGGTKVIRTSASQATESALSNDSLQPQLIIYKDGGSFYFACTDQTAKPYKENLAKKLDLAIDAILAYIRQNPEDTPANVRQLIRLWTAVPCFTFLPIPDARSNQSIGQYLDDLRQTHYRRETALAQDIYAYSDQINPYQTLATIINTLFIFERALPRTDNLMTIWTQ